MKKILLFIFAAIVAANMVSCRGGSRNSEYGPPRATLSILALDKNNNDLLDTTKASPIDLKKVKIYENQKVRFDGSKLPSPDYKLISISIGQEIVCSFNLLSLYMNPFLKGEYVVDWGNGVFDTLYAKELGDYRIQLFYNKQMVWDNKDDTYITSTTYVRRFE